MVFGYIMIRFLALIAVFMTPTVAMAGAKVQFSAYEGPESIKVGTGGTKITKNGVDYWTSGSPPRRYQIIGMITDKRDEEWDGGHAVGSPKVARLVLQAGGDAVIISSQTEGGSGGGAGFGGMFALGGSKTLTTMTAIKYLAE